jgi:hypothetical protein
MLLKVAFDGATWLVEIGRVVGVLYLFLIIVQLIINMKNKPEAVEKVHSFCAIYFCLYMLVFTGVTIRCGGAGCRVALSAASLTAVPAGLHLSTEPSSAGHASYGLVLPPLPLRLLPPRLGLR